MDTFAGLMLAHAASRPHAVALRFKARGVWHEVGWAELCRQARGIACGLAEAGLCAGEHVAVIGDPRPRLTETMLAVQALGGVVVPLDPEGVASEVAAQSADRLPRFAVVEGQEQVDAVLAAWRGRDRVPRIWCDSARGLDAGAGVAVTALDALIAQGQAADRRDPTRFDRAVAAVDPDRPAAVLGTTAATGGREGVARTHRSLLEQARSGIAIDRLSAREDVLAAGSAAWTDQHLCAYVQWLACGYVINFPESPETIAIDLREIGPTYWLAPCGAYDQLRRYALQRMDDASGLARGLYARSVAIAARIEAGALSGTRPVLVHRLQRLAAELSLLGPLRDGLGLSRLRVARSTGEVPARELSAFYRLLGIRLEPSLEPMSVSGTPGVA